MTDQLYREWIQTQKSCLSGHFSEYVYGDGRCVAAHVRRAGKSGVGYKAEYSCLPLTQPEHLYQHQYGELACLIKYTRDAQLKVTLFDAAPVEAERIAKDWFDDQVERYREMWNRHQGITAA